MSKSSLSSILEILTSSFKMAIHPFKLTKENPTQYIKLSKDNIKRNQYTTIKVLTQYNFYKIIKRFPVESNFYISLQIAFHTGIRSGEVYALS